MLTYGREEVIELNRGDVTEARLNPNKYGGCGHGRGRLDISYIFSAAAVLRILVDRYLR